MPRASRCASSSTWAASPARASARGSPSPSPNPSPNPSPSPSPNPSPSPSPDPIPSPKLGEGYGVLCFNGIVIEGGLAAVVKALLEWTKVSGQG